MAGIHEPNTIDLVGVRPDGDCVLIMIDDRPWDGSRERLREVQAKIETYATYVASRRLVVDFPEAEGRRVRIQLDSNSTPDDSVRRLLTHAAGALEAHGIVGVSYNVRGR